MSAVSLQDIKFCVLCKSHTHTSEDDGALKCPSASCNFKLSAEGYETQMSAYVTNGAMKFCFACGGKMEGNMCCGSCYRFDIISNAEENIISASEVKNCVVCSAAMETKPNRTMYCSTARCKFRIKDTNTQKVTQYLHEYSAKGKVRFCYACGSKTSDDGEYNMCSSEDCISARLPSGLGNKSTLPTNIKLTPNATSIAITEASDSKVTTCSNIITQPEAATKMQQSSASALSNEKETAAPYEQTGQHKNSLKDKALVEDNGDSSAEKEQTSVFSYLRHPWKSTLKAVKYLLTTKKARPVYMMVLIGETGSGKTSFFNLVCNYDIFCELEGKLDSLHSFHDLNLEKDQHSTMESKTSDAKCYKVKFDELEIGFIDTPGFGDSRGMEEDRKNVRKIIHTIEKVEYVNCICLVINGRQARASYQLKYVLTEISATLPKSALNNLIIIMTNCQNVLDANFDLNELSTYFGADVVIKPEHVFYIDNPYSKLEKCRNEKKMATQQQLIDALRMSFSIAGDSLMQMLETIKDFGEVHTNCFVLLYNVKQEVENKMLKILVAHQNKEELQKQISLQKQKLDAAVSTKTLNEEFTSTFKVRKVVVIPTTKHNTICGAPNCNSNCHVPCHLSKTIDKENLRDCACIEKNCYTCTKCGHSYLDHFHAESMFELQEEENTFTDEDRKKKFEDAQTQEELCVKMKAEYDARLKNCETSMKDLQGILIATVEKFQNLGSNPSYEKMLECQIYILDQRINAQQSGDNLQILYATKKELTSKLMIVRRAITEVQSVHTRFGANGTKQDI